jgi:hypothetical protein
MSKSSYFAGWLIDGTGTPAQQAGARGKSLPSKTKKYKLGGDV